jgi:hypothetical protein
MANKSPLPTPPEASTIYSSTKETLLLQGKQSPSRLVAQVPLKLQTGFRAEVMSSTSWRPLVPLVVVLEKPEPPEPRVKKVTLEPPGQPARTVPQVKLEQLVPMEQLVPLGRPVQLVPPVPPVPPVPLAKTAEAP